MPSKEHDDLIWMAANWIENRASGRGCKGNSELCIAPEYVADFVCQCTLQHRFYHTYCKNSELQELQPHNGAWSGITNDFICIFEAKTTRSDFLNTFNESPKHMNRHEPFGNLHWCVVSKGIIKPEELPDFWGMLERSGNGLREVRPPKLFKIPKERLYYVAHQILWTINKRRHYHPCKLCGTYKQDLYCKRCLMAVKRKNSVREVVDGGCFGVAWHKRLFGGI